MVLEPEREEDVSRRDQLLVAPPGGDRAALLHGAPVHGADRHPQDPPVVREAASAQGVAFFRRRERMQKNGAAVRQARRTVEVTREKRADVQA